jgi:hypothetical protein
VPDIVQSIGEDMAASIQAQRIRVDYEYIKRHQRVWEQDLAPLIGQIARLTRELEWQGTRSNPSVVVLRPVLSTHERTIDFVRPRADEGVTAQCHIARALAEIVAYYESVEGFNRALMATGGVR